MQSMSSGHGMASPMTASSATPGAALCIGFVIGYTVGVASGDKAKQDKAAKDQAEAIVKQFPDRYRG